jgi:hypothetical protein
VRIGKSGSVRTVLLDDCGYVTLLKLHLARAGLNRRAAFSRRPLRRRAPSAYRCSHVLVSRWWAGHQHINAPEPPVNRPLVERPSRFMVIVAQRVRRRMLTQPQRSGLPR